MTIDNFDNLIPGKNTVMTSRQITIYLNFQNLPELEHIDLAYNSMNYFDFDYLDQVGTLGSLTVNISHNLINSLVDNSSNFGFTKDHCKDHLFICITENNWLFFYFSILSLEHQDTGYVPQ